MVAMIGLVLATLLTPVSASARVPVQTGAPLPAASTGSGVVPTPIGGAPSSPPHSGPANPLGATFPERWVNVSGFSPSAPSPRFGASLVYDPTAGYTLLFGGETSSGTLLSDTWEYRNGAWVQLPLANLPPPREGASMVYYPPNRDVYLFGGNGSRAQLNDTWTFASGVWSNVTSLVGVAPSPRSEASMSFVTGSGVIVLFGGYSSALHRELSGTWQFHGVWARAFTSLSPSPRSGAASDLDPYSNGDLLFGGNNGNHSLGDLWEYSGVQGWTAMSPVPPTPPARSGAVLLPSAANTVSVLFGGAQGGADLNDTWVLQANAWTQAPTPPALSARDHPAGGADPFGNPLLVGGRSAQGVTFNDTWVWTSASFSSIALANVSLTDVGMPVAFSSSISGGTAPYRTLWGFGDGTTSSTALPTHVYGRPGNYTVNFTVMDALGQVSFSSVLVSVERAPWGVPTISPSPAEVGQPVSFLAVGGAGIPPLRYSWSLGNGTTAFGAFVTHTYPQPGGYWVFLNVTDAVGGRSSSSSLLTVVVAPTVAILTNLSTSDVGIPVNLTASVARGLAPFTYLWGFGDGTTSTLPSVSHAYASSGPFAVSLNVTDSAGSSARANLLWLVEPTPTLNATASPATDEVGEPVSFAASLTGGATPWNETWRAADGWTAYGTAPSHSFTTAGTFVVRLFANDSGGAHLARALTVTVVPAPSATLSLTGNGSMPLSPVQLAALVHGGIAPFSYLWSLDGSVWVGATGANATLVPTTPGDHRVTVTITDARALTAQAAALVFVQTPGALSVSISVSPDRFTLGGHASLQATVSGAVGALTYEWLGVPATCAPPDASTFVCDPNVAGNYSVELRVTDALGRNATSTSWLDVTATSSSPTVALSTSSPDLLWYLFGVLTVVPVVAILLALLLRRRSRDRLPSSSEPAPEPAPVEPAASAAQAPSLREEISGALTGTAPVKEWGPIEPVASNEDSSQPVSSMAPGIGESLSRRPPADPAASSSGTADGATEVEPSSESSSSEDGASSAQSPASDPDGPAPPPLPLPARKKKRG